jgi:hypothetical protein
MNMRFSTRSVALLIAMLFCMNTSPLYAMDSAVGSGGGAINGSASEKLSQLEVRFFEHPYGNDNVDGRLKRLELFVFGAQRTGTEDKRLTNLIAALPTVKTAAKPPVETTAERAPAPEVEPRFAPSPATAYGAPTGVEATISELEQQVTGNTNKQQSLHDRVSALENIVGAPNADHSGSIVHRVARLQNAVGSASSNGGGAGGYQNEPSAAPPVDYKQAYTAQSQPAPILPREKKEHPMLRTAAKTALVVGAVAGVAALTIMASRGMGGGSLGTAARLIPRPRRDLF